MENLNELQKAKNLKIIAVNLYEIYLSQANQKKFVENCSHINEHDNSSCHPDYHLNSHLNVPGRMLVRTLEKK